MVDSADPSRLEEAKRTFLEVIQHEQLQGVPVLCLANKQDKPEAMSTQAVRSLSCLLDILGAVPKLRVRAALQRQGLPRASLLRAEGARPRGRGEVATG